jgi:RNA polymerase sigma-70 factor (ECF subfamily)
MMQLDILPNLLDRVVAGDQAACKSVLEQYRTYVYSIALKITKCTEDAEEVTQDTFIKAFKSLKNFNRQAKFSTWLYRIAFNTSLSCLRKKRLASVSYSEMPEYQHPGTNKETSSRLVLDQERSEFVQRALELLKPEEQYLISLYYLREMSMEEVADISGYTVNNVKVKIHRARKRMHTYLQKLLPNEAQLLTKAGTADLFH